MPKRRLPRYCSWNHDQRGNVYVRFRRAGYSVNLHAQPGTPEFDRQYADALLNNRTVSGMSRVKPGSMKALAVQYYASPEFRGLREATCTTYRGIIERFLANKDAGGGRIGDRRVDRLERRHLKTIIGAMSDRPQAANNLLSVLRRMLTLAVDVGMIETNPAWNLKGYPSKTAGFHTWTDEELNRFEAHHPRGSKARLAYALMLYTTSRRGDVINLGRQHLMVQGGTRRLRYTQSKTGAVVDMPVHPALWNELASQAGGMIFLLTEYGKPFTRAGFGNWFRARCNEAGLAHCSAHGLRKAGARRMAEAGRTANQIGAITGHQTLGEIERYTRAASRARLADAAVTSLGGKPD